MITLVCASHETHLPKQTRDVTPVICCADIPQGYTGPYVGRRLPNVLARLSGSICPAAYDLLAISMAVTAADTFVDRQQNSDDGGAGFSGWSSRSSPRTLAGAYRDDWRKHFIS